MNGPTVERIPQRPELRNYIKDIWIFRSNGGLHEDETRIIAPNGSAKLVLNFRESVVGRLNGHEFPVPAHRLSILGAADAPMVADFDRSQPFGCISIEFNPTAIYRLLGMPQYELRNAILPLGELASASVIASLEEQLFAVEEPADKVVLLQEYLVETLLQPEKDNIFEYCAERIMTARGVLSLRDLFQQTGYSERWLRAKFMERLGLNPKTFASLMRFQSCYSALLRNRRAFWEEGYFYRYYYDQAHFIKEFKRFMGYPPARYATLQNEVGEIIYTT